MIVPQNRRSLLFDDLADRINMDRSRHVISRRRSELFPEFNLDALIRGSHTFCRPERNGLAVERRRIAVKCAAQMLVASRIQHPLGSWASRRHHHLGGRSTFLGLQPRLVRRIKRDIRGRIDSGLISDRRRLVTLASKSSCSWSFLQRLLLL